MVHRVRIGDDRQVTRSTTRAKADPTLLAAADLARAALTDDVGGPDVGEHLGHLVEGDRVLTHLFGCTRAGYRGWRWHVTIMRASRHKVVTVAEVVLIPGDEAILAPGWVPYRERIQPGDLSPGDLLPVSDDDPRLVPTYTFGDDGLNAEEKTQVRSVAGELGLGRVRTLSREGRDLAAQRWYDGPGGPHAPLATSAPARCVTCGFLVRLQGGLTEMFGVCANGDANDDGRVVTLNHGCGAHSEVQLAKRHRPVRPAAHVFDTVDDLLEF